MRLFWPTLALPKKPTPHNPIAAETEPLIKNKNIEFQPEQIRRTIHPTNAETYLLYQHSLEEDQGYELSGGVRGIISVWFCNYQPQQEHDLQGLQVDQIGNQFDHSYLIYSYLKFQFYKCHNTLILS